MGFELGFDEVFLPRVLIQDLVCFLIGFFKLKYLLLGFVKHGEGGAWTSSSLAFYRKEDVLTDSLPFANIEEEIEV
jgi:hypothetical protein